MAQAEGAMLGKKMNCPLILLLDVVCSAATRPATYKAEWLHPVLGGKAGEEEQSAPSLPSTCSFSCHPSLPTQSPCS